MTELEKIQYAKTFMDKLANGINPLDDSEIPEGDIANNVRLSRCFFYVSDILRQVIENGGVNTTRPVKSRKQNFTLPEETLVSLKISQEPISVTEIAGYLNNQIDQNTTKKMSASAINGWLMESGFLQNIQQPEGKMRKMPTPMGKEIGILERERVGQYGTYRVVLFNAEAQRFVYDNIHAIVAFKYKEAEQ